MKQRNGVDGSTLLRAMDEAIAKKYGISHLTEKEQELFLLGLRMGCVATDHICRSNISMNGSATSYNYLLQIIPLFRKNECFEGKYYWNKLKNIKEEG